MPHSPKHEHEHEHEHESPGERAIVKLLRLILSSQEKIMADFTKLNAAVQTLSDNVDKLVAANQGVQTSIDSATSSVNAANDKVVSATPTS